MTRAHLWSASTARPFGLGLAERLGYPQLMIELLHGKFAEAAGRCVLAGLLISGLYAFSMLSRPQQDIIAGRAFVVDGDTIDVAGNRVRLQGIDAPERAQRCPARQVSRTWQAGKAARHLLIQLIDNKPVSCKSYGTDIHNRMLGICHAGDVELNAEMVRRGMAWAYRSYSGRYIADEDMARQHKAGVWRNSCQPPWEYRGRHRQYGRVKTGSTL